MRPDPWVGRRYPYAGLNSHCVTDVDIARVLPAHERNAGGSRAWAASRATKKIRFTRLTRRLTGLTRLTLERRGLTDTVLGPEGGIVRFANSDGQKASITVLAKPLLHWHLPISPTPSL